MTNNKTIVTANPGEQFVTITRTFDAPVDLVFRAYTDKELVAQWLTPKKYKMQIERWDAKDGGSYRYAHVSESGDKFGFNGCFHEVTPNERIIQTFEYEGLPERGHVAIEVALFKEENGKTTVTSKSIFITQEDRDGMVQSGMEGGLTEAYELLDELLEKMK